MASSITVNPLATRFLRRISDIARREFDLSLADAASLRWIHPTAEIVSVNATAWLSQCCGHAPDREYGADCGCQDVDVDLTFRLAPVIKGGSPRTVTVTGEVTLAGGEFQAPYWSWNSDFLGRVEEIVGKGHDARRDVEYEIERAV